MSYRSKLIVSSFLFVFTLFLFLPGAYSIDSLNQWRKAIGGHFEDWYGTGLVTSWRWLWLLTGSYNSLYVVQMTLYWTFITFVVRDLRFRSWIYWLTIGAALFFCFIPQYIMRDSLAALAWGIAAVLLFYADKSQHRRRRRNWAILSLLLLAYGVWVRINALVAFLPLAYIAIGLIGQKITLWQRLLFTAAAVIVLIAGIHLVTYQWQKADKTFPDYKLKLLDLSGISKLSGENLFPAPIRDYSLFSMDTLLSQYTPASIDDIYWPVNQRSIFPFPNDTLDIAVTNSWSSAIRRHPVDYLQNRLTGFFYYLRIKKRFSADDYWNVAAFTAFPGGPWERKGELPFIKRKIVAAYGHFYRTFLFDPWFWLLLNVAGFALFICRYIKRPAAERGYWLIHTAIQLSGWLFMLSQLPIYQLDRDFRYTYWNVFVTFIAIAGVFRLIPISSPDSSAPLTKPESRAMPGSLKK
jgi:hypothetical protein